MSALDHDAIWEKSRAVVRRAITARDQGQFGDFCLWCAVSLELLGKAVLSGIHPSLIADPQDVDSIFLACGKPLTANPKTITAKTVFGRIQKLSGTFGKVEFDFCMLMMQRRNADLHSGDLPFANLNPGSWAPRFWTVAELMLQAGGRTLADWVGAAEARRATALIQQAATVRQQVVEARLETSRAYFARNYPEESDQTQIRKLSFSGQLTPSSEFGHLLGDATITETCPACGCTGRLSGEKVGEDEPNENNYNWDAGVVTITAHFAPSAFRCGVCKMRLDGQEELTHVGMTDNFELEEEQEFEIEEPYLNE